MRRIKIEKAGNGFIIEVGCARFVSETVEHMLKEIERYIKAPKDVETEYLKAGRVDTDQVEQRVQGTRTIAEWPNLTDTAITQVKQ